ncbi:hypothetical protein RWE15_15215 [Virgibacillus halophilus]|uniref:Transcriptional regulator TetR C-terminal Firmicutes type domain-containing protein n=1 Tax=Tigheibacillus halophilus TaxID=361280 RepID=A0ABU5C9N2_9BACI|nr:hypothetical protein [Virgibacillus halophilus]
MNNTEKGRFINFFSELLRSIVAYHTGYMDETKAYITMVNSPIPNIKKDVGDYLQEYNQWLVEQLMLTIQEKYPGLEEQAVNRLIEYFIFIGNGLFWAVVIYEAETLQNNLEMAMELMDQCLYQIMGGVKNVPHLAYFLRQRMESFHMEEVYILYCNSASNIKCI